MERDDLVPQYLTRRWPAAGEVAHHRRVAVEVIQAVCVVLGELPQGQSLCLQEDAHVVIIGPMP
jgi:hypothetical protein